MCRLIVICVLQYMKYTALIKLIDSRSGVCVYMHIYVIVIYQYD
jgi:hypothetical protein